MANSDKDVLITTSRGLTTRPNIKFVGSNNTPLYAYTADDGTVSFEATAGQLFSIADGLTGTVFSVNDISGLPSLEVLDTGMTRITGSLSRGTVRQVNASTYTVNPFDNWINVTFNSTCTITLPPPGQFVGREITIKTANNSITVNSATSNIIARSAAPTTTSTQIVSGTGIWARLVSDGTYWVVMMTNG
jgi:hypothetical protein